MDLARLRFTRDLADLRTQIKCVEGTSDAFDPYVVACRLVLEKADKLEQHAHEIPGMGHLFTAIVDEFRQAVVDAVLLSHTELHDQPTDVTP